MAVTLRGVPLRERIEITGDIETTLRLPFSESPIFYLSFSDGTLIGGSYDEDRVYRFVQTREGAGITTIRREKGHDVIQLDWSIEWLTIASDTECAVVPEPEPLPVLPGLFEERDGQAMELVH